MDISKIACCYHPTTLVSVDDNQKFFNIIRLVINRQKNAFRFFNDSKEALKFLKEERQKNIDAIKASTADYRNHVTEQSPLGPIDAYQIVLLMSAHTVRHSKQIDEIKTSAGYPAN